MGDLKARIADRFYRARDTYSSVCLPQRRAVKWLLDHLEPHLGSLPEGPFLEIGCGTGLLTEEFLPLVSNRAGIVSDLTEELVGACETRLKASPHVQFAVRDGSQIREKEAYSLIISNYALQWLLDPVSAMKSLKEALVPGGILALSFPTDLSFLEWKQACERFSVPYSGNPMPRLEVISEALEEEGFLVCQERALRLRYSDGRAFFRSLRSMGADVPINGSFDGGASVRKLCRHWGVASGILITYVTGCILWKKPL